MKKYLCICLSSTIQRTVNFEDLRLCEVNRSKSYTKYASGKAVNSARVLNQLEEDCVKVICPLGKENEKEFIKLAAADRLNLSAVETEGYIRECWTLLDRKNAETTELVVGEPSVGSEESYKKAEKKLLSLVKRELKGVDGVLLAGSRPVYWSEGLCAQIARLVALEGITFMADYWGKDLLLTLDACTPNIVKINEEEFRATFKEFCADDEDLKKTVSRVSEQLGNTVVVTRGASSTIAAKCGFPYECDVEKIVPVNTTACGDSFSAGFLYEYVQSESVKKALEKGTWCAARNAELECPGAIR